MKPFYHLAPLGITEKMAFKLFPIWKWWFLNQKFPSFDVAYSPMGFATEAFEIAERTGALKIVDAISSHPTSFYRVLAARMRPVVSRARKSDGPA